MRLLAFSDFHFHYEPPPAARFPDRLGIQLHTCEWIAEKIRAVKPDVVVNLGDTNHRRGSVDMRALQAMCQGMEIVHDAARAARARFVILAGNHDQYDRAGEVTILSALAGRGIQVAESPDCDRELGVVPYTDAPEQFFDVVSRPDFSAARVLCIHQDVQGAYWRPGVPSEGLDASPITKGRDVVLCGHYHHPQVPFPKFHVVGSPLYYDWSDQIVDLPRGVLVVELQRKGRKFRVTRHENPHGPIRHTLKVGGAGEVSSFLDDVVGKSRRHRLLLRVVAANEGVAEEVRESVSDRVALLKVVVPGKREYVSSDLGFSPAQDPRSAIQEFVDAQKLDRRLDPQRLVRAGQGLAGSS